MVEIVRYAPGVSGEDNTEKRKRILNMHNKPCYYGDDKFKSILALANRLGVAKSTVNYHMKKGQYKGIKIGLL